jgi:hypothetical protein
VAVRIRCPYCGAEYEVPEGVSFAVCPYCGTVVRVETGEEVPQYFYPPRLGEHDAYAAALSRASQMPGAPRGLSEQAVYRRGELHLVPLYICRASAAALEERCSTAREEREATILATRGEPLPGVGSGYPFPTAGRVPYDPSLVKGSVFHQADRGPEEGCARLEEEAARAASREAVLSGCSGGIEKTSKVLGVAHYPFWLIEYSHPLRREPLRAVVDAVDATAVYVEYPVPGARRALLAGLAAAGYLSALATAAAVAAWGHLPQALLGGAAVGLAAAAPGLRRATARLGRYRLRAGRVEETVVRLSERRRA